MNMLLRKAEPTDIPALKLLLDDLDLIHRDWYPDVYRPLEGGRQEGDLAEMLARSDMEWWVVDWEGQAVALGLYLLREQAEEFVHRRRSWLEVDLLVVRGDWRGKGCGRRLMEHALERLGALGMEEVTVNAMGKNAAAMGLYLELGFGVFKTTYRLKKGGSEVDFE